jgi:hypothetical protein
MVALLACPKDKAPSDTIARIPLDTVPQDLSGIQTSLPPQDPDTHKVAKAPTTAGTPTRTYPAAPEALMAAVSREAASTEFCYNEFGLKVEPSLRGNVALVVTVGSRGVTAARVGNSNWAPRSGGVPVNRCLNERAKDAIKLAPGAVKSGEYLVQLSFTPR